MDDEEKTSDTLTIGNLQISPWVLFYLAAIVIYMLLIYVEVSGKTVKDFLPTVPEQPQVIEGSVT
jgi:hypothetical protein